jgi:hypothetical protein
MVRVRRRIRGKKCSKKGKVVNSSMNMEKPANGDTWAQILYSRSLVILVMAVSAEFS